MGAKKTIKKAAKAAESATNSVMGDSGKSLFFLILSMVCFWLVLDLFYGNGILKTLVGKIFWDGKQVTPPQPPPEKPIEKKKKDTKNMNRGDNVKSDNPKHTDGTMTA